MSCDDSPTALVSSFYGPGPYACWICQAVSLSIASSRGRTRKLTLDFVVFAAYPTIAAGDVLVKLAQLYAEARSAQPGDEVDPKVLQLVTAWRAPLCICTHALTALFMAPTLYDILRFLSWFLSLFPLLSSVFSVWLPLFPPWTRRRRDEVLVVYIAFVYVLQAAPANNTWASVAAFICLGVYALIVLQRTGDILHARLPLSLPSNEWTHMALGTLLFGPVLAAIAVIFVTVSRLVSWGAVDASGVDYFSIPFNNSISELDQAVSLLIGLTTVAWSMAVLLHDRGYLGQWNPNDLFSERMPPDSILLMPAPL